MFGYYVWEDPTAQRWIENPEWKKHQQKLRLSSLKATREQYEKNLVRISQEIDELEKQFVELKKNE